MWRNAQEQGSVLQTGSQHWQANTLFFFVSWQTALGKQTRNWNVPVFRVFHGWLPGPVTLFDTLHDAQNVNICEANSWVQEFQGTKTTTACRIFGGRFFFFIKGWKVSFTRRKWLNYGEQIKHQKVQEVTCSPISPLLLRWEKYWKRSWQTVKVGIQSLHRVGSVITVSTCTFD